MCLKFLLPVNKVGGHEDYSGLRWSNSIQRIKEATKSQSSHPLIGQRILEEETKEI